MLTKIFTFVGLFFGFAVTGFATEPACPSGWSGTVTEIAADSGWVGAATAFEEEAPTETYACNWAKDVAQSEHDLKWIKQNPAPIKNCNCPKMLYFDGAGVFSACECRQVDTHWECKVSISNKFICCTEN